jgi:hypothetical protein
MAQVVDGDGALCSSELDEVLRSSGVAEAGLEYSLVAIMGPQSSGKSTLLNHVFGTCFREMDATAGRSQTTQGIWLAGSPKLRKTGDVTLVLDLEGTDGRERGEDDTTFERQSALFALAVSDVLLINLWHHDVGREHGSGKPLLRTVLQENLKLFNSGNKKTLVFVIRDRSSKTPLEALSKTLREDLEKIWAGIPKSEEQSGRAIDDCFHLMFTSLPNFEEKEEEFEAEATLLRSKFKRSNEDSYLPEEKPVPGSALAMSIERIWTIIKENKNLDLPAHRVMVATVRCDRAILDLSEAFSNREEVRNLQENAAKELLEDYGSSCKRLIERYEEEFDASVELFEPSVCQAKKIELVEKLEHIMSWATSAQNEFCRMKAFSFYGREMDKVGRIDFSQVASALEEKTLQMFDGDIMNTCTSQETPKEVTDLRLRLMSEMESIQNAKVKDLKAASLEQAKKLLSKALYMPFTTTFEDLPEDTWSTLRSVKTKVIADHTSKLEEEISALGMTEGEVDACKEGLASFGKERYVNLIEEAVKSAPKILKDKFVKSFCYDGAGMPRVWGPKADVGAINLSAKKEAVKALSLLALSQIGTEYSKEIMSEITDTLDTLASSDMATTAASSSESISSLFASDSWPGAEKSDTLLDPIECRSVWRQMESEISYTISQAVTAHEASKQASNRGPPLWTIMAMLVLGWNELVSLLYNPVLLILVILLFVFARAIYTRIDLGAELEKGFVPALVSISLKLVPIVLEVGHQFAYQVKEAIEKNAEKGKEDQPIEMTRTKAAATSNANAKPKEAASKKDD